MGLFGVAGGGGLVGCLEGGAGLGLQVLLGLNQAVEFHLQLVAVADDVGGLLGDVLVLLLRGCDGLLDLHLRVGILVDLGVERLHKVLPAFGKRVRHGWVLSVFVGLGASSLGKCTHEKSARQAGAWLLRSSFPRCFGLRSDGEPRPYRGP